MCRPPFKRAGRCSREHDRDHVLVVLVAVAHARPVHDERMIEQRAVAVRSRAQLLHEVAEQRKMVRVDLRVFGDARRDTTVVRDDVVRLGHADLRVADAARFDTVHERGHASDVGAPRERDQVVHHADVLVVRARNAGRRVGSLARRHPLAARTTGSGSRLRGCSSGTPRPSSGPAARAGCSSGSRMRSPNRECWPCS